jgi:predicted ATPase/DNA-binding CsgD family transcriptional regulator
MSGANPIEEPLSGRELEILPLLAEGLSNREIGQRLFLSAETVKWYNKRLFEKLGASNRAQAAARAREAGLLDKARPAAAPPTVLTKKSRLPAQLTAFVGRQREIQALLALLDAARLVTITGPGGSGKTRLSLQVAEAAAARYAHGAVFVGLALTSEPERLPEPIARALEVTEQPNQSPIASLRRYLAQKHLLLILDNFEHLLRGAPLVTELLAAAPGLIILATSREALRLSGEHEYHLPPLSLPAAGMPASLADLLGNEAVSLFSQRAQSAWPGFQLTEENAPAVAAICRRLDGLPLAIELAAARVKLFGPQQMLARLESRLGLLTGGVRDAPARQRTLRDAMDWSYNLLEPDEQRLFARLAVFAGGRTIEALEAVCAAGLELDAVDGLESLLNKNLLFQREGPTGEPRFHMLETIKEYARERLVAGDEERQTRDRHLAYYLALAEEMEPGYWRHGQLRLLDRAEAEQSNFNVAFSWALENQNTEAAARLVSSLDYFLRYKGSPVEGYRWFKRVIPAADRIAVPYRLRLLLGAARLAWVNNDLAQSEIFYQAALALAQDVGDESAAAWAMSGLAANDHRPEAHQAAMALSERALDLFRALDERPGIVYTLGIQGELARIFGDFTLARQKYEAALAASEETGERYRQLMMRVNLSLVAYNEGDYQKARDLSLALLEQMQVARARQGVISQLWVLAGPLARLGQPEKAARLIGASAALLAEMGALEHPSDLPQMAAYINFTRQQLGEARFEAARTEGATMTLEQAVACALAG